MKTDRKLFRCAVYTRKSSEEGLEQDFNSLHAQREACEAYIASQRSEGWKLVTTPYDDGGLSGGNMQRPGLQRLLSDIQERKIDVVVVYKVDRLTRSLADFAKMVEVFDAQGVSFVAVTQQFNTTTSMGRLTLNVLLSFAQFEREVTGERIRDKIAASKQKGMWMGGNVPLGYAVVERKLSIIPEEAETVRTIFRRYLELGCVRRLRVELKRMGLVSKVRHADSGKHFGGNPFSPGALYALLKNPIYVGLIRHKDVCHPGQHEAIIDQKLWDSVQQQLSDQAARPRGSKRKTESSPLMGKLFDEEGQLLTPSHANKQGRRYRYYISTQTDEDGDAIPGWRLPAREIERKVSALASQMLQDRTAIARAALSAQVEATKIPEVMSLADHSEIELGWVQSVQLSGSALRVKLVLPFKTPIVIERSFDVQMRRRGVEQRLVIEGAPTKADAQPDPALMKVIRQAWQWWETLTTDETRSAGDLAQEQGLDARHIGRVLRLAMLAPDIVTAIASGKQPPELTAKRLLHGEIPASWKEQRRVLGFG